MPIDISNDLKREVKPEDLAEVINKARELMRLELEIGLLEKELARKIKEYELLSTDTLPELMDSIGCPPSLSLANGYLLELKPVFRASIPAEGTIEKASDDQRPILEARRAAGLQWLVDNKASDLIKNEVRVSLGKGQSAVIRAILSSLNKIRIKSKGKSVKPAMAITQKEFVHPSTLASFLKEKLEAGADVPTETFGVFKGRQAQIKAPKKEKS